MPEPSHSIRKVAPPSRVPTSPIKVSSATGKEAAFQEKGTAQQEGPAEAKGLTKEALARVAQIFERERNAYFYKLLLIEELLEEAEEGELKERIKKVLSS